MPGPHRHPSRPDGYAELREQLDHVDALVRDLYRIEHGELVYMAQPEHLQVAWWAGIAQVELATISARVRRLLDTGYPF